jgi:hypothetical protein
VVRFTTRMTTALSGSSRCLSAIRRARAWTSPSRGGSLVSPRDDPTAAGLARYAARVAMGRVSPGMAGTSRHGTSHPWGGWPSRGEPTRGGWPVLRGAGTRRWPPNAVRGPFETPLHARTTRPPTGSTQAQLTPLAWRNGATPRLTLAGSCYTLERKRRFRSSRECPPGRRQSGGRLCRHAPITSPGVRWPGRPPQMRSPARCPAPPSRSAFRGPAGAIGPDS